MTTTFTQTFNRDDIRRVYAAFAADYRIIADWTGLHSKAFVDETIVQVKALAEEQYLKEVHLQLVSMTGAIRQAVVHRVSTDASGWTSDRPGDLYWEKRDGDRLILTVAFSQKWWELTQAQRDAFVAKHMRDWGTASTDGAYSAMTGTTDRHYSSRAYGMERTRYTR